MSILDGSLCRERPDDFFLIGFAGEVADGFVLILHYGSSIALQFAQEEYVLKTETIMTLTVN